MYYGDYLQLDKILDAQHPESDKVNKDAHDEMLFIVIHQAYELWFKQILYETGSVMDIMNRPQIDDNSPDLQVIVHRLSRVCEILKLLVKQIDVIETMTSLDFLDFRDMLRPASGFQSMQFKILEAKLGLKSDARYGKEYYVSQLREDDRKKILSLDNEETVLELVNAWLSRMPYFDEVEMWEDYPQDDDEHPFWAAYRTCYLNSLVKGESQMVEEFDKMFFPYEDPESKRKLSMRARRAALFIMLFRGYPQLHLPFRIINQLLEIDELMATWRYRHVHMVHRIIGSRVGTGGSTGKNYLKNAMDSHHIFSEFAELNSFLVERSNVPKLSEKLNRRLGYGDAN
jgi:tryptophan 2,3-dioxygenase